MRNFTRYAIAGAVAMVAALGLCANATSSSYRAANTQWVSNYVANVVTNTNPAFSNAVLGVGIGIDTNSVAVLNEIASGFGNFPLTQGETATTVGGLLVALAAAVAWLKKHLSYTAGATASDRVCAVYTISEATSVTVPRPYTDGKIADFVVYLDMTDISSGDAPAISYKYDGGEDANIIVPDGTALSYSIGAVNCVYFSQIGTKPQYIAVAKAYKSVPST